MIKKLLFIFLLQLSFATFVCAQTRTERILLRDSIAKLHKKFFTVKGVKLKPRLEIAEALRMFENNGWKKVEDYDKLKKEYGNYVLTGVFFNTANCYICICPTNSDPNIVGAIIIDFPDKDSFKALKEQYDKLKYALNKKYYIHSCKESFDDKILETSSYDDLKLSALKDNQAKFETKFDLAVNHSADILGFITLNINCRESFPAETYRVSVMYATSDALIDQLTAEDDL